MLVCPIESSRAALHVNELRRKLLRDTNVLVQILNDWASLDVGDEAHNAK